MPTETKSALHPDDLMVVTVSLEFQAKINLDAKDPPSFDVSSLSETFSASDAAGYLDRLLSAIRDRRLYGFMVQEAAEGPVGAGDWIAMTPEDIFAALRAEEEADLRTRLDGA